ncbi:MAG: leucine-rich repeat domain-containing protein [Clostridia bacterium]|nr:leucine-rich repeat domain-containing protein [Clostridia bacterium]
MTIRACLWRAIALLLLLPLLIACDALPDLGLGSLNPLASKDFPNGEAYVISYVSNGDGTCYVNAIRVNPAVEESIDIVIPATSPDGDRVVTVRASLAPNLPTMLDETAYLALSAKLQAATDAGLINDFERNKMTAYFEKKGVDDGFISLADLEALRQEYPLAEFVTVYILAKDLSPVEIQWLCRTLSTIGYTSADWVRDCQALHDAAQIVGGPTREAALASLPALPLADASTDKITSILLPDSVTYVDFALYTPCTSITQWSLPACVRQIPESAFPGFTALTSVTLHANLTAIEDQAFFACSQLTEIHFEGSTEQWEAIQKGKQWKPLQAITVHCSDGTVTE